MENQSEPFCLLYSEGVARHARGQIVHAKLLAEMPRPARADRQGLPVISMVPYTQLRERGYELHDDSEPILSLVVSELREVDLGAVLPDPEPEFSTSGVTFEVGDDEYGRIVQRIVDEEICHGMGSNFLISRRGRTTIHGFSADVAKAIFGRLVRNEPEAYLTFCFYDGSRFFVGASPERHLTFRGDQVTMAPISGTLPKKNLETRADLLDFLTDPKEVNELFQVVDEQLKMITRICEEGGTVSGPFLREMSSLIHTEYQLVGRSRMDKIDAFRESMYAATMIGSPLESAARVIRKYEHESRRYYSSAIVLNGLDEHGAEYLDSAITIRTMEIDNAGETILQSGGSIVRDSDPVKETKEAEAKVAGLVHAISSTKQPVPKLDRFLDPEVENVLRSRNANLSRFWVEKQALGHRRSLPGAPSMLVIDNEDQFTEMLAHLMTHIGYTVEVRDYDDPALDPFAYDLVTIGPGPGDPNDDSDPKIARVRGIIQDLLRAGRKFLAVCLGHQLLCRELGMEVYRVDPPLQGVQLPVDLFGREELVGFYNTFFARQPAQLPAGLKLATRNDGRVVATRSDRFCSFQFHVESVLTSNNVSILAETLELLRQG
jgi:2-amino-4-deoxychorismate synthase